MKTDSVVKSNAVFSTENVAQWAPGKYVVIDPCYVYQDNDGVNQDSFWDEFCEYCFPTRQNRRDPVFVIKDGVSFVTWSTKYGDGDYPVFDHIIMGNDGHATAVRKLVGNAGVDSGTLALIPLHEGFKFKPDYKNRKITDLGVIVEVNEAFTPEFEDGSGFFGNITVVTNDVDEEENEDD